MKVLRAIEFDPTGGLIVQYLDGADVKDNGAILYHAIAIPSDWDEADTIYEAVQDLVDLALERWRNAAPLEPVEPDDGPGPYENPEDPR